MKTIYFNALLFCLFIQNLAAQSGEVSLNYQYGIAGSRLRANNNSQDNFSEGKSGLLTSSNWLNDHIIGFNYKHQFIKSWNVLWNFGIERGSFNRFNNIFENGIIYDVVKYRINRMEYQIGLIKRFELKISKINFDCGFDLSYRQYEFSRVGSNASEEYQTSYPYGTVQYEYDFYYEDFNFGYSKKPKVLNLELQFNSHFPIYKNFYLDAGARLAFDYVEYQYTNYTINHYDADGNFLYFYNLTYAGAPKLTRGNYLYLTLGLSYRFDWQKIKLFNKSDKE